MSFWTALGFGAGATATSVAAVAVVAVGAVGYFVILPQFTDPDPSEEAPQSVVLVPETTPDAVPETPVAPALESADVEALPNVEDSTPDVAEGPLAQPPSFGVVRIDAVGSALVAGMAEPGKIVELLLDGVAVTEIGAGGDGNFVAFFEIPPSDQPRSLQLSVRLEDGALLSEETILIAPFSMPVAEVTPEDTPEVTSDVTADAMDDTGDAPVTEEVAVLEPVEEAPDVSAPANLATRAPAAPALVVATSQGVRVLQQSAAPVISAPDAPQIRVNVTIDTISYTTDGAVEIAGRGQGGGFVRLYLDNKAVRTAPVTPDGVWGTELEDVTPGIYTLRVDELGTDGAVTSRFETPFKREEPAIVAAAQNALQAPEPVETQEPSVTSSASAPTVTAPETVPEPPKVAAAVEPEAPVEPVLETAATVAEPITLPDTSGESTPAATPVLAEADRPDVKVITVQPGFTLWQIAQDMMGQGEMYVQVYEANRTQIRNPNLIYPGQVFTMPGASLVSE